MPTFTVPPSQSHGNDFLNLTVLVTADVPFVCHKIAPWPTLVIHPKAPKLRVAPSPILFENNSEAGTSKLVTRGRLVKTEASSLLVIGPPVGWKSKWPPATLVMRERPMRFVPVPVAVNDCAVTLLPVITTALPEPSLVTVADPWKTGLVLPIFAGSLLTASLFVSASELMSAIKPL